MPFLFWTAFIFGSLADAPRSVRTFFELLEVFDENVNWALRQLTDSPVTTAVEAVEVAVRFSNFRLRDDRLRRNMLATLNEAL